MDTWERYLFESHSQDTLYSWAKRLKLFRFFRAYGGHANDGDSLDLACRYNTCEELEGFLSSVGIILVKFVERPSQHEKGVSYRGDEFARFPSIIPGTKWARQPGHSVISDQKVFVWCERGLIKISVGERCQVTERDVSSAEIVEKTLINTGLEFVDPPFDTKHYVCPKYYPECFV